MSMSEDTIEPDKLLCSSREVGSWQHSTILTCLPPFSPLNSGWWGPCHIFGKLTYTLALTSQSQLAAASNQNWRALQGTFVQKVNMLYRKLTAPTLWEGKRQGGSPDPETNFFLRTQDVTGFKLRPLTSRQVHTQDWWPGNPLASELLGNDQQRSKKSTGLWM